MALLVLDATYVILYCFQDGSGSNVEAERLTMHRCIISSIIESESVYVECLYVMEKVCLYNFYNLALQTNNVSTIFSI